MSQELLDELTSPPAPSTEQVIYEAKLAAVEDAELFKVACVLVGDIEDRLSVYETLGGKYKQAFGTPMFNSQQMAGSPAVSGGMSSRASAPKITPPQAQPTQSQATASPRAQAQSMTSIPSASPQTSAPSAAPAAAAPAAPTSASMG